MQLSVYALALQTVFKKHADRLVLSYINDAVDRKTVRNDKDIKKAQQKMVETMKKIQEQNFVATPNQVVCQFCPFNAICDFSSI